MHLREWRIKEGLTVQDLSDLTSVPVQTLYCYENGSRRPRRGVAQRIEVATKGQVTVFELLGIETGAMQEMKATFETELPDMKALSNEAKELGLDASSIKHHALNAAVKKARIAAWIEENREAFEANAKDIRENGLWCDKYRQF